MTIPLGILGSSFIQESTGLEATYIGEHEWTTTSTATITFSNVDLGPAIDRTIFILLGIRVAAGGTGISVTVAGFPAVVDAKNATHTAAAIARVRLPASVTTGNIVVTTGASWYRRIGVYYSTDKLVKVDTASDYKDNTVQETAVTTVSGSISGTLPSDLVLAQAGSNPSWATSDWDWTGLDETNDALNLSRAEGGGVSGSTSISASVQPQTSRWLGLAAAAYREHFDPLPGAVVFDSFNRSNAVELGVSDSGHLWIPQGTGQIGINSGMVYRVTGTAFALIDFGQKSHRVSARVVADGPYFAPPLAGASDANNYYWISGENNGGQMRLKATKNGLETSLGVSMGTYVVGDVIGLEVTYSEASSTIRMFNNGVQMGSDTVDSNSDRPKGTMVGLRPAGSTVIRQDDFLAVPPNYWSTDSQLLSDEYDCGVDHSVVAHASAVHTTGPQFVADTGSSFGVSSAAGLLTSGSNTGYAGRVIADVGQPEVKVSARIKGMLTSMATAADRHYGLVLGALGVDDASGAVGLHANMGGLISLQQISGSAWLQNLANTGVTFTVTDDFVITLQVKGNLALATVNGRQAMLYLTNPPTGTFAGLYVSRSRWDNTYGYDSITIEAL